MADAAKRKAAGAHGHAASATLARPAKALTVKRDLKDPAVQHAIMYPPTHTYTLSLATGDREIVIPTEFAVGQTRALIDDLEQWFGLVIRAMRDLNPLGAGTFPSTEYIERNGDFVAQAMMGGTTRAKARLIILRIATFTDVSDGERTHPTLAELDEGLSSSDLTAISSLLFRKHVEETNARAKKRTPTAT
jgi:hypothetical protein